MQVSHKGLFTMLTNVFLFILRLSLTGAIIAAVILVVKKLTGKMFSSRWHYFVWFLLLVKLLVPFSFSSSLSLFNIYKSPTDFSHYSLGDNSIPQISKNLTTGITEQPLKSGTQVSSQQNYEKSAPTNQKWLDFLDICAYIWLCGVIVLLAAALISYWRMYRRTTKVPCPYREYLNDLLQNCSDNSNIVEKISIRYSKYFISPFTFGIIEPCIVIPETLILDKQKLEIILKHELVHIKRHDYITRVLSYVLQAIHWFNPLIWISFKLMAKDCEISCDSTVIKSFDENMRNRYAMLLIETAQMINVPQKYVKAASFSESNLTKRIHSITGFKKHSIISVISSALVFVALSVVLVTGANANDNILNENFQNIKTIKVSCKGDPNLIRIKNQPVQWYNSLDQKNFILSIYNPNNILLFNINNIDDGTYVEKILNTKSNEKECRMFYDIITKKSKERTLQKSEYFYNTLYTVEITYKDGKVDYLLTDSKYGEVYKPLKNGNFVKVRNMDLLYAINKYSSGLLSDTNNNLVATTYYGEENAESLGIEKPKNGKVLSSDELQVSPVYGKGRINGADKTAQIEIASSQLPKIKKGSTVYLAYYKGTVKSVPDPKTIKSGTCTIKADMENISESAQWDNLEFDASIYNIFTVPIRCIQKGNNGKQYIWVSYKRPEEMLSYEEYWLLAEAKTGQTDGKMIEVTDLNNMFWYKSIIYPI